MGCGNWIPQKSSQTQENSPLHFEFCRSQKPDGVVRSRIKRYSGLRIPAENSFEEWMAEPPKRGIFRRHCDRERRSVDIFPGNTLNSFTFFPDSNHDDYFDDRILPDAKSGSEERNSLSERHQQGQLHVLQFVRVRMPGGLHLRSGQPDPFAELPPDRHESMHWLSDVLSISE